MPTSLKTLLTQFQARYPLGGLSAELLTIHQNQYIVRAVVQFGNTILATGMAGASEIEAAEDRAKTRALEALGLAVGSGLSTSLSSSLLAPLPSSDSVLADTAMPAPPKPPQEQFVLSKLEPEPEPETNMPAGIPLGRVSKAASQFSETEASLPSAMPFADQMANSFADAPLAEPEITAANQSVLSSLSNRSGKSRLVAAEDEAGEVDQAPVDFSTSVESPLTASKTVLSSSSPAKTEVAKTEVTKTEKAGKTSKRKSDFELPPAPIPTRQPSDRSEEIMKIGIEMKRLGWSTEQGREYLKRTYGKRSRQELDDAELLDFLRYLETQPASVQAPF